MFTRRGLFGLLAGLFVPVPRAPRPSARFDGSEWKAEVQRLLDAYEAQRQDIERQRDYVAHLQRASQRQMEQIRRSGESSVAHCQQVQMQLANSVPAN